MQENRSGDVFSEHSVYVHCPKEFKFREARRNRLSRTPRLKKVKSWIYIAHRRGTTSNALPCPVSRR